MNEFPGQTGLSAQTRPLGAAPAGQMGLAVQLGSNVLVRVLDQTGRPVRHGLVLTLSYPGGGPATEELSYDGTRPIRRTLPAATTVVVAAEGPGFETASGTYNVPPVGMSVFTLVVRRLRANQLLRWR